MKLSELFLICIYGYKPGPNSIKDISRSIRIKVIDYGFIVFNGSIWDAMHDKDVLNYATFGIIESIHISKDVEKYGNNDICLDVNVNLPKFEQTEREKSIKFKDLVMEPKYVTINNLISLIYDNDDIHVNVDIYGKHYIQRCERMYCGTLGVLKDHISESNIFSDSTLVESFNINPRYISEERNRGLLEYKVNDIPSITLIIKK